MREKTCCFTGHRRMTRDEQRLCAERLDAEVRALIAEGICYFGVGGAVGFDALAAETVLRLRREFPHIRLIVVLACADQAERWNAFDRRRHEAILARADKVVCLQERYADGCMQARNRHLVDHSGVCVSYLTDYDGGTGYTVGYARRQGVRVVSLAENA
ncbi:MAG: DUF1273 family protein [Clostridia bacterium]|nr:DUF1273 family protein [Clostridia bacterium]